MFAFIITDIGQPAASVAGKSPVKKEIESVKIHTSDHTESEGDDGKDLQERIEMADENSSESDMDEYEGEEGDDDEEEEEHLQDESTDTQSGREHEMVENKAVSLSVKRKRKIGRPRKRRRDSDLPPASPPQRFLGFVLSYLV